MKLYVLVLRGYSTNFIEEFINADKIIEYYDNINELYNRLQKLVAKGENVIVIAPLENELIDKILLMRKDEQILGFITSEE